MHRAIFGISLFLLSFGSAESFGSCPLAIAGQKLLIPISDTNFGIFQVEKAGQRHGNPTYVRENRLQLSVAGFQFGSGVSDAPYAIFVLAKNHSSIDPMAVRSALLSQLDANGNLEVYYDPYPPTIRVQERDGAVREFNWFNGSHVNTYQVDSGLQKGTMK